MCIRSRNKRFSGIGATVFFVSVFMLVPLSAFAQFEAEDTDVCRVTASDVSAKKAVQVVIPIPGITQVVDDHHYVKDMGCYVVGIYRYFAGVAGILATVMMMWGGVQYVISIGNPQKITQAKDTITGALMGLLLVLGSFSILYLINPNLTTFSIPQIEHIAEVKWGDCGKNASYSSELDQCVLECPAGYAVTDCYMCKEALTSHSVVWSNDICSTDNLSIGKVMTVRPNMADAIQDAIGKVMYSAVIGTEIYLFGGPSATTVKAILGKIASTTIKIEAIDLTLGIEKALTNNPMYQGKKVFTDPRSACCAQESVEAGASVCKFVNGFTDIWEGQCSGILPCKDTTPCGEEGPDGCQGIYAEDNICVIIWGQKDNEGTWEGYSTREGDPNYWEWATVVPATMSHYDSWGQTFTSSRTELCVPNELINVPVNKNVYCSSFDLHQQNWVEGLGSNCQAGYQCVLTHERNTLTHGYVDGPALFEQDGGETCSPSKWKEVVGWNRYVSEYSLFRKTDEADQSYWLSKGGHCLPITD